MKIAAALALIAQGNEPLLLSEKEPKFISGQSETKEKIISTKAEPLKAHPQIPMRRYRIEVGSGSNIKPGNILGAIANEAEIDSEYIGSIQIFDNFSTIDLPDEMPHEVFTMLQKTVVAGKRINIIELTEKNNRALVGGNRKKKSFSKGKFARGGSSDRRSRKGPSDRDPTQRRRKPKFSRSKPKKSS
jgi:ATP-dependent RNA helicase DeaD